MYVQATWTNRKGDNETQLLKFLNYLHTLSLLLLLLLSTTTNCNAAVIRWQ